MPAEMKAMIADALNELLNHKSLDKITVKELVDTCHISRQTFYYHFRDIMEVVEWYQSKVLEQSIASSLAAPSSRDAVAAMVRMVLAHRKMIQQLMASQRRAEIERIFLRSIRAYLEEMLRRKAPELALSPADAETILCFCSSGMVGLMLSAIEQKEPDPEVLSRQMHRLLTGEISLRFTDSQ